jgi:thiol-disulfide isomerase/thioredoxin
MKPHRLLTVALLSLSLIGPFAFSQELIKEKDHDHADHDKKEETKKPEAKVSADAKSLLDQVTAAYKQVGAVNLSGKLTADIDVAGDVTQEKSYFDAWFQAPNKFRHEIKDAQGRIDMVMGSTGEKLFAFRPRRYDYKQAAAPTDRVAFDRYPNPMRDLLQTQNPSLMAALSDDASKFLLDGVAEAAKVADTDIAGVKHPTLEFKTEQGDYRVALDPQSKLIRRMVFDLGKVFAKHRDDVKKYLLTYDYANSAPVAQPPAPEMFAWAVPDDAREAVTTGPDLGEDVEKAFLGKPAPDFSLKGMDGKSVSLADLKGSVIVLDFWATWCGPCRASLPSLNALHKELKPKGLQTFAVNLEETKDIVQPVAAKLCPDIPVLFDEDSKVGQSYGVNGIPHTVVIGKDGKIRRVIIGAGDEARLRAAVEKALNE